MAEATERLRAARLALEAGFAAVAVSAAYYAMLYAARAALSERDAYAKTHAGVWTLFSERFVASGQFDAELAARARRAAQLRERGDYEAARISADEAATVVEDAARFVAAIADAFP